MIIRKVPGMQLPDLASTSLFTAVGLNHKKLARPSENPTNSSRSWFPLLSKYVRLFESMECSSLNLFFFSKLTINLLFKIFLDYLELKMILVDEGILGCMGYDLYETNFKMRAAFGSNLIDLPKRLVMVSTACIANY